MKEPAHGIKRLVLLDAHAILHRAYHALPDFATSKGEPTGALYGVSTMLLKIITDLKPDYVAACYDLKGPTHRHEVFKAYKAQRKETDDALVAQMDRSRDIFHAFNIPIYDKKGFEADDILGTIVEQMKKDKGIEIVIASGDMDTMQLIDGKKVRVYTLKKGLNDTIMYDEEGVKARYGFGPELIADYKGLRGDPSDNIPGIKGIGEKTATTLITSFGSIEDMYKTLEGKGGDEKFAAAGLSPRIIQLLKDNKEEAEFSKMLSTIRRNVPMQYVLPEKSVREGIDVHKITALWNELEFRTLPNRLKQLVSGGAEAEVVRKNPSEGAKATENETPGQQDGTAYSDGRASAKATTENTLFSTGIDPLDLEKTSVALWLVDSTKTDPTLEDILNFANTESYEEAKKQIFAELDKREVRKVYDTIELPLIPVLHKMSERGVKIDRAILAKLSKEYRATASRLEKEITAHAGTEFNINSPKQLGEILFDKLKLEAKGMKKTAGGARSTKESELEKLRGLHPIIPLIFEYRELQKLLGTYIDAIPPLLDSNDRLHTRFISSGSTTGRMATQNPGLQNIPVKTELGRAIRQAFVAEKGFTLVGLDYSQMELRIAAFLAGDKKLIDIFKNGEDVHKSVASYVFKVPQDKVDSEMRRRAKVINFGIIYGMGVLALKQNLGTTRDEAQKFYNDYFAEFATLAKYLEGVKEETARRGYTETFFGRRRYFEGIKSKLPFIRAAAERMAINAPIQGTGADVLKIAMIRVFDYIKKEGLEKEVFPVLTVHDELIFEVRDSKAKQMMFEIKKIMESVIDPKDTAGVVMKAEGHMGDNWGELK